MNKVFAVGVGPGSSSYVTDVVKNVISKCDVIIGYGYTIKTIEGLIGGKQILEVTMKLPKKTITPYLFHSRET